MLVACDPSGGSAPRPTPSGASAEPGPGTLRWALGTDPTSLDPRRIVRDDDALVVDALFDSLTRVGPDLEPLPALATGWTASADATSFRFDLDPDARWHDGSPVLAEDVVRGLQRVADGTLEPPALHADLLRDVAGFAAAQEGLPLRGVTAEDERVVRIDLVRPAPELPLVLAHPGLAPVPPVAVDDPALFGEAPVGNGPFQLVEPWAHNQFLRLAPSATHPAPDNLQEVVFRVYASDEDRAIRHADLLAGQIQVSQVPPGRRAEVEAGVPLEGQVSDVRLLDGLTDSLSLLLFDTRQPPFDDPRFRRGVSLLVDREALAARTEGAREPARSLVPPVVPGARRGACAWCRHDPVAAARLIGDVLAERPEDAEPLPPIVLQTSPDAVHATLAAQLSAALRGAGLEVRVVRAEPEDYLEVAGEEQPAVIRLGWDPDEPTLRAWSERLFGVGSPGAQRTGWQPGSLRDLLANAAASSDPAARQELWAQVIGLALDAAVVAPVLHYRDDLLVAEEVEGLERDPFGNVDLARVRVRTASG